LGEVRARYGFALPGYVIMPEHLHVPISEADIAKPESEVWLLRFVLLLKFPIAS
jgi:hypothetical protein